ncbi:MAG TPA: TIGR03000 domain-containing protein, partial [Gemmataceae bacterium]
VPVVPAPAPAVEPLPKPKEEPKGTSADAAHLILELPEGSALFIDGNPIPNSSPRRKFHTPALRPGQAYFYDVRVVVEKDGRTVEENKRVVVRAGETVEASFTGLTEPAPLAVADLAPRR